jgi:hypothetical protein
MNGWKDFSQDSSPTLFLRFLLIPLQLRINMIYNGGIEIFCTFRPDVTRCDKERS